MDVRRPIQCFGSYFWVSLAAPHWSLLPLLCLLEFWLVPTGTGDLNHQAPVAVLPRREKKKTLLRKVIGVVGHLQGHNFAKHEK